MAPVSPSVNAVENLVFFTGDHDGSSTRTAEQDDDPDVDVIVEGGAETSATGEDTANRQSMYVQLFEEMVQTVMLNEKYLFSALELKFFDTYTTLSYDARYLLVRIALRKQDKWHRLAALKYERELEGPERIIGAMDELCRVGRPDRAKTSAGVTPDVKGKGSGVKERKESVLEEGRQEGIARVKREVKEEGMETSFRHGLKKGKVRIKQARALKKEPTNAVIKKEAPEVIDLTLSDGDDDMGYTPNITIPPPTSRTTPHLKQEPEAGPSTLVKPEFAASTPPPPVAPPPSVEASPSAPGSPSENEPEAGPSTLVKPEFAASTTPLPVAPPPSMEAGPSSPSSPSEDSDFSFIAQDDTSMSAVELLNTLSGDELKEIAKSFKIKTMGSRREGIIGAILSSCSRQPVNNPLGAASPCKGKARLQTTLCFDGGRMSTQGPEARLRAMLMDMLVKCIQLNPALFLLFRRINIVYLRSTQLTPKLMTPGILTRAKKRVYAPYTYARTACVWASRAELLAYENALEIEARIDEQLGGGWSAGGSGTRARSTKSQTPAVGRARATATPARGGTSVAVAQSTTQGKSAVEAPASGKAETEGAEMANVVKCKDEADDDVMIVEPNENEQVPDGEAKKESHGALRAQAVREIFDRVFAQWKELVRTKCEDAPRPGGLERFESGHVLTRVVCKGAHALGILKERAYELVVLNALLSQTRWRRGRRSRWHERRACLLMTHWPKERQTWQQAINFVEEAIKDEDTHIVYRPKLERRLTKLEKKLEYAKDERHISEGAQLKEGKVYIIGERVWRRPSVILDSTGRAINQLPPTQKTLDDFQLTSTQAFRTSVVEVAEEKWTGKSIWLGNDDENVNVETFALQQYETQGFKGCHCEGRIVSMLFGILFWDIIFAPIPGAFETPYQSAPLDIAEDTFYYARQDMIDERLREIEHDAGRARGIVDAVDGQHREKGTWCVGVRWDAFERQDLLDIVECLGGKALSVICRLFAEDYAGRASGVPDLFIWNAAAQTCKFVEVKGPGDVLSENQKTWIDVLVRAGVSVDVCHVAEKGEVEKKKGKGKGKGSKLRPKSKRAVEVDSDVGEEPTFIESEDEEEEVDQLMKTEQKSVSLLGKKKRRSEDEASPQRPTKRRS